MLVDSAAASTTTLVGPSQLVQIIARSAPSSEHLKHEVGGSPAAAAAAAAAAVAAAAVTTAMAESGVTCGGGGSGSGSGAPFTTSLLRVVYEDEHVACVVKVGAVWV